MSTPSRRLTIPAFVLGRPVEVSERRLATAGLGVAMLLAAALILWEGRGQTFFADEWAFLTSYRSFDPGTILKPDGGSLLAVPLLAYNALFATVGADSYVPFRIVALAGVLVCALLFFLLARRRVGDALALPPTVLLLVLGAAWDVVVSPIGIAPLFSVAAGLGMLLCLDRGDARGDLAACGLLVLSLASFSPGVAFAAGAAVELLLRNPERRWRRAWVFLVPIGLYAAWTLWALRFDQSQVMASNIGGVPAAIVDSLGSVTATLTGLFRVPGDHGTTFRKDIGIPIGIGLAALLALRLRRGPPPSTRFWAALAMALAYWTAIGLVLGPGRAPESSRYLYPGSIFVLLAVLELAAGWRPSARGWLAVGVAAVAALSANVTHLHDAARFLRSNAELDRAELAALELASDRVSAYLYPPRPAAEPPLINDLLIQAGDYLDATAEVGSPAYDPAELGERSELARRAADLVLVRALRIEPQPVPGLSPGGPGGARRRGGRLVVPSRGCLELRSRFGEPGSFALVLPRGGFRLGVPPGAPATVGLRRFADRPSVRLRPLAEGSGARIAIPPDAAPEPWRALVRVPAGGRAAMLSACGLGGRRG